VVDDGTPPRVIERPRRSIPPAPASAAGSPRVGGNIRPPTKTKHVSPIYPATTTQGVVVLSAVIGSDGYVKDTRALSSPDDDLARAAIDAVNEWEFDPTLLDGIPIDTLMQVTVSFRRQP
jgi:TonB family protein